MKSNLHKDRRFPLGVYLLVFIFIAMLFFALSRGISIGINMETRLQPPSARHLLGTDYLGRDLLSCIIYGAGISLLTGVSVVLLSALVGALWGIVAGLAGGVIDNFFMRIVDIILAFPGILLALALVTFFRQGLTTLILVLSVSGSVCYARIIRGEVLKYKQKDFILAARSYNASFSRIIFFHLLPLTLPLIVVQASLDISAVILAESGLNFLGFGLDPLTPTLGQLIDAGRAHIFDKPHLIVIPGLILFLIIIAFNFIGEGLRKKLTR
jgi:peptide/nickel transport system permease protein